MRSFLTIILSARSPVYWTFRGSMRSFPATICAHRRVPRLLDARRLRDADRVRTIGRLGPASRSAVAAPGNSTENSAGVACHLGDTARRPLNAIGARPTAEGAAQMAVLYPLEFFRRSEQQWKSRITASTRPEDDAAAANRDNECCPIPVAKPFVSRYLHGCVVEHHWHCKTCEVSWSTHFHPL